jgi:hypothetical protein
MSGMDSFCVGLLHDSISSGENGVTLRFAHRRSPEKCSIWAGISIYNKSKMDTKKFKMN